MHPLITGINPVIARNSVVLPEPFDPIQQQWYLQAHLMSIMYYWDSIVTCFQIPYLSITFRPKYINDVWITGNFI